MRLSGQSFIIPNDQSLRLQIEKPHVVPWLGAALNPDSDEKYEGSGNDLAIEAVFF